MAKNTIAARKGKGKEEIRGKLTQHEIALIVEMLESGMSLLQMAERLER